MRMTRLVLSLNRHFFATALIAIALGIGLLFFVESPLLRWILGCGVGVAAWLVAASTLAVYLTYDASDLLKVTWWPDRVFSSPPESGVLLYAEIDPVSSPLRRRYPGMELSVFDIFDSNVMTETSIQRAREWNSSAMPNVSIPFDDWPVAESSQDVVFAIASAHELRHEQERVRFFSEAQRVLKPDGIIVVIEQLRDPVNFLCFGPAAFHFHSRHTWLQTFAAANLSVTKEFQITPFMTTFVLQVQSVA
ncbi:MAG: class I SAM-dependent methyltransferase [Planctomycetaceae bacterium]|nr:class I SAM-dependent methyltransferase [Planctomycetaceae bacterium]MCA9043615.1 class I SAM-dependent methyltransferase [Planctomycetaceae bacterium]MCB9950850.1 class I SAM-dependent methyltransferase [Planctomycetaceae bacterium]